jgi:predicted transcriptional regulator
MAGINPPYDLSARGQQPCGGLPRTRKSHDEERSFGQGGANFLGLNPYRHMPKLRERPGYPSAGGRPIGDVRLYTMNRRTQIYLDESQTAKLDERAAAEGTTRSTLIRRAIDAYLAQELQDAAAWREQWQQAVAETAGIAPHLEDGVEYVDKLRRAEAERSRELWR